MADEKPNFGENPPEGNPEVLTISRADLDAYIQAKLDERDAEHAAQLASVRALIPVAMVSAHAGGPGTDNHQRSWSLAEQEAAARGEVLEHWT